VLFNALEYGEWIAVLVYVYAHGGATAAGLVAVGALVPCALAAPVLAVAADRYSPATVLVVGYATLAASMFLVGAAILAGLSAGFVYAASIVAAVPFVIPRPAQAALLPGIARSAEELTAANVVSGWSEGVGVVLGPLLVAVTIDVLGSGGVLVLLAAGAVLAAALMVPVARRAAADATPAREAVPQSALVETREGLRAVREVPGAGLLVALLASQFVAIGTLDILSVVMAFQLLGTGQSGVALLNAAFGAGGVASVALTVMLVGRRRLAPPILVAAVVWGVAFAVLAAQSQPAPAYLLLALAAAMRSVLDVAGRTLLQRTAPTEVLARVFGLLEGLVMAALAAGSLLVPVLVATVGARGAVVGVGLVLPLLVLATAPRLLALDGQAHVPVVEISLLRRVAMFRALPPPEIEALARNLDPLHARAGELIIRQGDHGNQLYLVSDGSVSVHRDGRELATLERGQIFGEIALLHSTTRMADVVAVTDTSLYSLAGEPFLAAVTGHLPAHDEAQQLAAERLATSKRWTS